MFSGIIEEVGRISCVEPVQEGAKVAVRSAMFNEPSFPVGSSVSIDGVCLTVTAISRGEAEFDVGSETLRRTTFSSVAAGKAVNLERGLRVGGRVDGHFVLGHVDGTAQLAERSREGDTERFVFQLDSELAPLVIAKGSIAINGVSLTVGETDEKSFSVYLIPHTLTLTTLSQMAVGELVNIEVDCLVRYVQGLMRMNSENCRA